MADNDFLKTEELIRKNPGQANARVFEWERFLKANPENSSEILSIKTEEEFHRWSESHPEKHVDPSIWEGKEISEYYLSHPKQPQENVSQESEKKEILKELSEETVQKPEANYAYIPQPLPPQEDLTPTTSSPLTVETPTQQPPSSSRSSGGGISRGINNINSFARRGFSNPLGKVGQRVIGQTALRGFAAFLAGPGLPIVIAVVLVFIFTFIIVGFGGAPSSEQNSQTTNITPTETITPPIVATQAPTPAQETITPPAAP